MLELKWNRVDFPGYVVHICAVYPTLQPAWHYIWWFGCHPGYAGTVFATPLSWHQITLNYDHPVYHVFLLRSSKILYLHRGSSYHGLFWKILFWGACMNILSQVARDWQARLNKLPPAGIKLLGSVSAWTATLLFMWAPVAQAVCVLIVLSFRYATCYVYEEGSELHIGLSYLQNGLWNLQIRDMWIMWCWGTVVELLESCQHKGSISVHCVAGYGRERFVAATRSIYSRSYVVCFSTNYWECGQSFLFWLNSGLIWLVSSGDFESLTWIRKLVSNVGLEYRSAFEVFKWGLSGRGRVLLLYPNVKLLCTCDASAGSQDHHGELYFKAGEFWSPCLCKNGT